MLLTSSAVTLLHRLIERAWPSRQSTHTPLPIFPLTTIAKATPLVDLATGLLHGVDPVTGLPSSALLDALRMLYDGRSADMGGRGMDHLFGVGDEASQLRTLFYQLAAGCSKLIGVPMYVPTGNISKEKERRVVAILELAYEVYFGTHQRNEALLELCRRMGLCNPGDNVVGANGEQWVHRSLKSRRHSAHAHLARFTPATPCLEPPTTSSSKSKSIKNPEYARALFRHRQAVKNLQHAVESGSREATESALAKAKAARREYLAVIRDLFVRRKELLLDRDADQFFQLIIPKEFLHRLKRVRPATASSGSRKATRTRS